jgi:hypothetical protein
MYDWRSGDADFAAAWDAAVETGTDMLEDEATRRALEGSDLLLIFLLRAKRPELYNRKQQVALSGDPNAPPIAVAAEGQADSRIIILPHNGRGIVPEFMKPPPGFTPSPRVIEATAEPVADETKPSEEHSEACRRIKVKVGR